jgi:hypothetical protein
LLPVLELLAGGIAVADSAGRRLLRGPALILWQDALRMAPPQAIELSLRALRVDDGQEPGSTILWGPARHLAAAPVSMSDFLASRRTPACHVMGQEIAAVVIACILQRAQHIESAGGYLRVLTEKARSGEFSVGPMLMAALRANGSTAKMTG